jgi:predicted O-methyltransferase YrrM
MTKTIQETIEGGCGCPPDDMAVLAQTVKNAGDGDYLELGTFFGGSAILASLVKKEFGIKGEVWAIDDLEFYKNERSAGLIMRNAEKMGASINLTIAKTSPFPYRNKKFNCIFIDAGHDISSVFQDWVTIRQYATKYVAFHDYSPGYEGVIAVVKFADFTPVHISAHMAVLERR